MTTAVEPSPAGRLGPGEIARWGLLGVLFVDTLLLSLTNHEVFGRISPLINALALCGFSLLHGARRYGWASTLAFLAICYVVSIGLEISSVHNGFPFGIYYYSNAPKPWIFGVPIGTGAVYFGMAYVCWMITLLVMRQGRRPLRGSRLVLAPVIATFLMVGWDFCVDPVNATILKVWVWPNGGSYFGVPLSNYAGWFLAAYIIFQLFALYIARRDPVVEQGRAPPSRRDWREIIAAYFLQALVFLLYPISRIDHREIYESMALAALFAMILPMLMAIAAAQDAADEAG